MTRRPRIWVVEWLSAGVDGERYFYVFENRKEAERAMHDDLDLEAGESSFLYNVMLFSPVKTVVQK